MTGRYFEPTDLDALFDRLGFPDPDPVLLAGGTAVVPSLRRTERTVIGLRRVRELHGVRVDSEGVWIGAMTTHRSVEMSETLAREQPMLASAFGCIGSVRIRNQATVGGNLAIADPAWDPPCALLVLDATVAVAGPHPLRRELSVGQLVREGLGAPAEQVIIGVRIPPAQGRAHASYVKVRARGAAAGPVLTLAVNVHLNRRGLVESARLALGAVAATAVRASRAEAVLTGDRPTAAVLARAAAAAADEIDVLGDTNASAGYRRAMIGVWVERGLIGLDL